MRNALPPFAGISIRFSTCALLLFTLLAVGCGKKLSGRYESTYAVTLPQAPGLDPKALRQINSALKGYNDVMRATLEFKGSKVRLGHAGMMTEHRYRIIGNRLELHSTAAGQKLIIQMTIQPDGSIVWMGQRFRKVK